VTSTGPKDKFSVISSKITKAEQEFEPTKSLLEGVERDWQNVAKLFAKDPATIKPEAFCGLIWEFVVKYNNTIDDKAKREEAAAKIKTREDIEAKKKRKNEPEQQKKPATDGAPASARGERQSEAPASPSSSSSTSPSSPSSSRATSSPAPSPSVQSPTKPTPKVQDEEIQVDAVLQEFQKTPTAQVTATAAHTRRSSLGKDKDGMTTAEKRKLLEEKRKKLAAAKAAKNKS